MVLPGEIGTQTVNIDMNTVNYKMNVTIENLDMVEYVTDIKLSTKPLVVATPQYISFAANIVGFTLVLVSNVAGVTVTAEVLTLGR
ncbi:unnamed protein product [marine sediment metagenome]|uniref:Uncharacterized protein n=1 Tax=marine sediment metagenome TaxID=412755 RepID=X1FRU1_9ZZZZ